MRIIKISFLILSLFVLSYAGFDSLVVTVKGDTVTIVHINAHSLCNTKYVFDVTVTADTITIVERDTAKGHTACRCGYSNLSLQMVGLREGNYVVQTFRQELMKYNYKTDTTYFMCSVSFAKIDSRPSTVSYRGGQTGCGGEHSRGDFIIYTNSFESPRDTIGWKGFMKFHPDAPAEGGKQSACISGGCIWPHAWIELPAPRNDGRFLLRCWGKNLGIGGSLSIEAEGNYYKSAAISIHEKEWTFYESAETLFCPAGKKIILALASGGFAPSSMLVDRIEIAEVDMEQATTGTENREEHRPRATTLFQNYPNPFNPATTISFMLPSDEFITLKVFDLLGREITVLVQEEMTAGYHSIRWVASPLASGMYFYSLQAGNYTEMKKLSIIR